MDGRRLSEPLSDAALDRELDQAFAVEPSPEFVTRVRARVTTGRVEGYWWSWRGAVAAASVVVVGGAIALGLSQSAYQMRESVSGADIPLVEPHARAELRSSQVQVERTVPPSSSLARVSDSQLRERTSPQVSSPAWPDVIIATEERRGFELFLVAVEQDEVEAMPIGPVFEEFPSAPAIEIPPVVIAPLPQIAQLQGGFPW